MKLSKVKELLKKLDVEAKKTNKAFERASKAQKRVMVLEDALKQLRRGKYKAESGTYFEVDSRETLEYDEPQPDFFGPYEPRLWSDCAEDKNEIKSIIDLPITQCRVCAIGGAFASIVRLKDRRKKGNAVRNWHYDRYMNAIFPAALLRVMEEAFESVDYGYDQEEDSDRLKAIYRNIIKNGGKKFTHCKRWVERVPSYDTGGYEDKTHTSDEVVWSERGSR